METLKKIASFFGLCFYVVGSIGGFGVSIHEKVYFIACCVATLAALGFPIAKKLYGNLVNTKIKSK